MNPGLQAVQNEELRHRPQFSGHKLQIVLAKMKPLTQSEQVAFLVVALYVQFSQPGIIAEHNRQYPSTRVKPSLQVLQTVGEVHSKHSLVRQ